MEIDNISIFSANNSMLFSFTNSDFTTIPSTFITESIVSLDIVVINSGCLILSIVICNLEDISRKMIKQIFFLFLIVSINPATELVSFID